MDDLYRRIEMKFTAKQSKLLKYHTEYLKREPDKAMAFGYIKTRPIDELYCLYFVATPQDIHCTNAEYSLEELDMFMKNEVAAQASKVLQELNDLYNTYQACIKRESEEDATVVVKMMVKYKSKIGSLVVRILKNFNDDSRRFFEEILPGLTKKYIRSSS